MPAKPLEILYEDNHLLAVIKPAGLPTMGVAADTESLLTWPRITSSASTTSRATSIWAR